MGGWLVMAAWGRWNSKLGMTFRRESDLGNWYRTSRLNLGAGVEEFESDLLVQEARARFATSALAATENLRRLLATA